MRTDALGGAMTLKMRLCFKLLTYLLIQLLKKLDVRPGLGRAMNPHMKLRIASKQVCTFSEVNGQDHNAEPKLEVAFST